MSIFNVPCNKQRAAVPPSQRRRCECYGCRLAAEMAADEKSPREVPLPALSEGDLNTRFLKVVPESQDAEKMIDEILGLALCAFDSREITEAQFRDLSAKCLDTLTYLAR